MVIPGTAELVDEVEESKITGEEERYSKLDLPDVRRQPRGRAASSTTRSRRWCRRRTRRWTSEIDDAFDDAFDEVERAAQGSGFAAYDELTDAQQRAVKQSIEALAEPLARVQGTLGVKG